MDIIVIPARQNSPEFYLIRFPAAAIHREFRAREPCHCPMGSNWCPAAPIAGSPGVWWAGPRGSPSRNEGTRPLSRRGGTGPLSSQDLV